MQAAALRRTVTGTVTAARGVTITATAITPVITVITVTVDTE